MYYNVTEIIHRTLEGQVVTVLVIQSIIFLIYHLQYNIFGNKNFINKIKNDFEYNFMKKFRRSNTVILLVILGSVWR